MVILDYPSLNYGNSVHNIQLKFVRYVMSGKIWSAYESSDIIKIDNDEGPIIFIKGQISLLTC